MAVTGGSRDPSSNSPDRARNTAASIVIRAFGKLLPTTQTWILELEVRNSSRNPKPSWASWWRSSASRRSTSGVQRFEANSSGCPYEFAI